MVYVFLPCAVPSYASPSTRWILVLFGFHMLLAITAILTRKNWPMQTVLLMACLLGTLGATYINDFAMEHWKLFAGQAYFDPSGFFISVMYSAPLIFIAIVILINSLFLMSELLIAIKVRDFKKAAKAKKNKNKKAAAEKKAGSSKKSNKKPKSE
mmetsp:Transcript_32076/g.44733  ORF Transcript_32076/g.44733 Transcript_32076/m.44733 type:complete len:155 (+) Transcript_32076:195-659(+)